MPEDIQASQEAIARAAISKEQETPSSGEDLTKGQQLANQLRPLVESENPWKAADSLVRPQKKEELKNLIDDKIGTEIDATGKKVNRTDDESDRKLRASSYADRVHDYLEKGAERMEDRQKVEAAKQVEQVFKGIPGAESMLEGLSEDEKLKLMEDTVLKNPKYREQVRKRLEKVKSESQGKDITAENSAAEAAKNKEQQHSVTFNRINDELEQINKRLQQPDGGNAPDGSIHKDLQDIKKQLPLLEEKAAEAQLPLKQVERHIGNAERNRSMLASKSELTGAEENKLNEYDQQLVNFRQQKASYEETIHQYHESKNRVTELESEKTELKERRRELEPKRDTAEQALEDARGEKTTAEAALAKAKRVREQEEKKFVEQLDEVFADAAVEHFSEEVREAEAAYKKMKEDEVAKAKGDFNKAVIKEVGGERWEDSETVMRRGRERKITKLDKDKVIKEFDTMHTDKPETVLRAAVEDQLRAENAGISDDELKIKADEKMKDTEFVGDATKTLTRELIRRKMQIKKLTPEETRALVDSDWGYEAIKDALDSNKVVKSKLTELQSEGVIKGNIIDSLKNAKDSKSAEILLAILFHTLTAGTQALGKTVEQKFRNRGS